MQSLREVVVLSSGEEGSAICISSDEDVSGPSNWACNLPSEYATNTRLRKLLQRGTPQPSGPSTYENNLLLRLSEYGITPMAFEVRMGGHQCDCIGVDRHNHLCVVEANSMHQSRRLKERGATSRGRKICDRLRAKTCAQAEKYAKMLASWTRVDVTCYIFDDTGDLIGLEPHKRYLINGTVHRYGPERVQLSEKHAASKLLKRQRAKARQTAKRRKGLRLVQS